MRRLWAGATCSFAALAVTPFLVPASARPGTVLAVLGLGGVGSCIVMLLSLAAAPAPKGRPPEPTGPQRTHVPAPTAPSSLADALSRRR